MKLGADAQAVYDRFAGKGWVSWASLQECLQTIDPLTISKAWNELVRAKLARGELSKGYQGKVFTEPESE